MTLPDIISIGSVKNTRGNTNDSTYVFEYTDRYSVFDWGEMPDLIEKKGEALAFIGDTLFKMLNVPHHSQGLVDENFNKIENGKTSRYLSFTPVEIIKPIQKNINSKNFWDYSEYKKRPNNILIPLEVIFRFGVPSGSSLLKRANDEEYRNSLGLKNVPMIGDVFETPIIEMSTKLEETDRYMDYHEAKQCAGLNDEEFENLINIVKFTAIKLKKIFKDINLNLWDGKFEFCFGDNISENIRELKLVDSIGPDELRLTDNDGVQISKEALRSFYYDSEWYKATIKSKALAKERGTINWKEICTDELKQAPEKLPSALKTQIEKMYLKLANDIGKLYYNKIIFNIEK